MEKTSNQEVNPAESQKDAKTTAESRKRRVAKHRKGFKITTPPYPVRALWEMAGEEERKKAHELGVLLLEHWLGRLSKKELGEKIGQPPLRVWQLSQQALAGLVVGLLKQPKKPPKGTPPPSMLLPEDNPKQLRSQILELQRQKQVLEELVDILKELPANREQAKAKQPGLRGRPAGKKNTARGERAESASVSGVAAPKDRKVVGASAPEKGGS